MTSGRLLVEDCLKLDLAWLMRLGPISDGQSGSGAVQWSIDGRAILTARFHLDLRNVESSRLILRYVLTRESGERKAVRQVIALTATVQYFGGRRWWLRCPLTGERVRTLHLPSHGDCFASRKVWGLAYRVERLSRFDRPFEKLFRVQRRLGGAQGLGAEMKRPKGMWQQTFARHLARVEQYDLTCANQITALVQKA